MSQYLHHWGLEASPYTRGVAPYPAPSHEEALARIDYLAGEGRTLGVLLGERGFGKSTALASAARQLCRRGYEVALVEGFGLTTRELLTRIASQLGATVTHDDTIPQIWQRLADLTLDPTRHSTHRVVLVDDAGQLGIDGQLALERLVRMPWSTGRGLSIVVAGLATQLARWPDSLRDLVELRTELYPWDELTTIDYLQHSLIEAGRTEPVFTEDALYRIHTLTDGNPRHVARLADFALVAGAAMGREIIESETVEGANREAGWKRGMISNL